MKLKAYLDQLGQGSYTGLAKQLGKSKTYITKLAHSQITIHPKRCVEIERITHKEVMRWDLRSDWREIWPELEAHPGAPKRRGRKPLHG